MDSHHLLEAAGLVVAGTLPPILDKKRSTEKLRDDAGR